jgi:hypothetical protein
MATANLQSNLFQNIFSANEFRISFKGESFESIRQHNEDHMLLDTFGFGVKSTLHYQYQTAISIYLPKESDQIDDAESLK